MDETIYVILKVLFDSTLEVWFSKVDRYLTFICKISKVNIGVGEMGFLFCDLKVCLNKSFARDINSTNVPCLTSLMPFDTSDSWNSSFSKVPMR